MDPYCWIHDRFWCYVCQDVEGSCYLQKCQDEKEGILKKAFISY